MYWIKVPANESNKKVEVQNKLRVPNRNFHASIQIISFKILYRTSKINTYKTIIRPVLMYDSEKWVITKRIEKRLITFESEILRKIIEPTFENGEGNSFKI